MKPIDAYRHIPRRGNVLTSAGGRLVLRLLGWRIEGAFPDLPKFLIIVAPHSSNWDWIIGMATVLALRVDARWIAKHTLFRGPCGPLMSWLGGIPVDRRASHGFVEQIADRYRQQSQLVIGVTPEGTRKRVETWKTGSTTLPAPPGCRWCRPISTIRAKPSASVRPWNSAPRSRPKWPVVGRFMRPIPVAMGGTEAQESLVGGRVWLTCCRRRGGSRCGFGCWICFGIPRAGRP